MALLANDAFFYSSINNSSSINASVVDFSSLGLTTNRVVGYLEPYLTTTITTDGLTEGKSSLYYTDARSRAAISASSNITYNSTSGVIGLVTNPILAGFTLTGLTGVIKATAGVLSGSSTTTDLPEGSNLYYTNARSRAAISGSTGIGYDNTSGIISNTGVTRLFGTTNRVTVSANSGIITVTCPQDINTNSSPQFARLLNSSVSTANVLLGTGAATSITTGTDNIIIGANTSTSLTTGTYNICIGDLAGEGTFPLASGLRSIYLGAGAYPSQPSPTREIVIGGISGNGSNTCTIAALNGLYVSNLSNGLLKATSGMITQAATSDYVASVLPGTNITITESPSGTFTINNAISITGTTNQINVSGTGALTLSTPQDIATTSNVQFARVLNSSIGSSNVLIGTGSGGSLTTGGGHTLVGQGAGNGITSGSFNIGIGANAFGGSGAMSALNAFNIAIGINSLFSCASTSVNNTAIGYLALQSLTTANGNIAIGESVARNLTTGNSNILYGLQAGNSISTSNNNIAIGNYSMGLGGTKLTGNDGQNVVIGNNSAYTLNSTAQFNVAIGGGAMYFATNASNNVIMGTNAGNSIGTSPSNVAIGSAALSTGATLLSGAGCNVTVGSGAGYYLAGNAQYNIMIGEFAGNNNATSSSNIYLGRYTQGSSTVVANEIIMSTNGNSETPINGRGSNTALIDARNGLYYWNPAICYLYGTALASGWVQWAVWDTGNVPTKGFTLTNNNGRGANTTIEPNFYGHYEITINGGIIGNGSSLFLTLNNINVRQYNIWFQSFSTNGIAYTCTATAFARPFPTVGLSGFDFLLSNATLFSGGLPLYACIKFIGF